MRMHERLAQGDICGTCGYRYEPIRRADAMAALLDLPAAYRAALDAPTDQVCTQVDHDGWTAIEYAAHAAEVLHSTRKRLVLVFERDDREVSIPHLDAVRASARTAQPEVVLAAVTAACRDLARLVGVTPDAAWERTARHDGDVVTARDLLTDALHEAHHHALDARAASGAAGMAAPGMSTVGTPPLLAPA